MLLVPNARTNGKKGREQAKGAAYTRLDEADIEAYMNR
jgi:hypothetical protein